MLGQKWNMLSGKLLLLYILPFSFVIYLRYALMLLSIRYRPTDTSEWKTMKIPSKKITEATILNLVSGREYEFMVLSQDKHGDGMFSKSIRVLTQQQPGNN